MRHENSVFHQLTKQIPWDVFDAAVERYGTGHRVRRLRPRDQFLAMLFAQFSGAQSLRETVAAVQSHSNRLYHLGTRPVARSTLADANASRNPAVYEDLFSEMVRHLHAGFRRKLKRQLRLLDATKLKLTGFSQDWARFSDDLIAAKLHLVYDPDARLPIRADLTPDTVNDITPARAMPIEPGATYVFDLAYYSFQWWHELDRAGCRFVTRLKRHTQLGERIDNALPEASHIRRDCTGTLSRRRGRGQPNPLTRRLREVIVTIDSGRTIRLLTNDLDSPAEEIADLYKTRWEIELLFKWLKQNLMIRRFIGTSENAVRTQVYIALIAYLLLRSAHTAQTAVKGPQQFARLIRANIMHRKPVSNLLRPPERPQKDPRQRTLELNTC